MDFPEEAMRQAEEPFARWGLRDTGTRMQKWPLEHAAGGESWGR